MRAIDEFHKHRRIQALSRAVADQAPMIGSIVGLQSAIEGKASASHIHLSAHVSDLQAVTWPVGSIFVSVSATNPGTLLGFGTWVAFAQGRVLVGIDSGQTEFDTVEETGGAKTHTLTTNEIPAHTHTYTAPNTPSDDRVAGLLPSVDGVTAATATGSTGGGAAHNNLQPYITVHIWKRTA